MQVKISNPNHLVIICLVIMVCQIFKLSLSVYQLVPSYTMVILFSQKPNLSSYLLSESDNCILRISTFSHVLLNKGSVTLRTC